MTQNFDLAAHERHLIVRSEALFQEQEPLMEIVTGYDLSTDEEYNTATDVLKLVKTKFKEIDAERTSWVKPLNDTVRRMNGYFKPALDRLGSAETALKRMIGEYASRKRQEQQRLLLAAAEEAAKQRVTDVEPPAKAVTLMQAASAAIAPEVKGISTVQVWRWELNDADVVPREYLSVDAAKLDAAVKAGVREIPGVRVFEDVRVIARTK